VLFQIRKSMGSRGMIHRRSVISNYRRVDDCGRLLAPPQEALFCLRYRIVFGVDLFVDRCTSRFQTTENIFVVPIVYGSQGI
jgi:hypothetical protein